MFVEQFGAATVPALTAPAPSGLQRDLNGVLLVAGAPDAVVGFAHLVEVDAEAHLEQISVLPEHGRRGIGSALVHAALEEAHWMGYRAMTLCTYRDVPWNGPFYRALGFEEVREPGVEAGRLRAHERRLGLDDCGPRIVMRRLVR